MIFIRIELLIYTNVRRCVSLVFDEVPVQKLFVHSIGTTSSLHRNCAGNDPFHNWCLWRQKIFILAIILFCYTTLDWCLWAERNWASKVFKRFYYWGEHWVFFSSNMHSFQFYSKYYYLQCNSLKLFSYLYVTVNRSSVWSVWLRKRPSCTSE